MSDLLLIRMLFNHRDVNVDIVVSSMHGLLSVFQQLRHKKLQRLLRYQRQNQVVLLFSVCNYHTKYICRPVTFTSSHRLAGESCKKQMSCNFYRSKINSHIDRHMQMLNICTKFSENRTCWLLFEPNLNECNEPTNQSKKSHVILIPAGRGNKCVSFS